MEIARACEGRRVTTADRAHAGKVKRACRYGDSEPCLARLPHGNLQEACRRPTERRFTGDSYLAAMSDIYAGCAELLAPGGYLILVTKNMRSGGRLTNLSGDTTTLCENVYWQHRVARNGHRAHAPTAPIAVAATQPPARRRER